MKNQAIRETLREYFKTSKATKKDIAVLTPNDLNQFLQGTKSLDENEQQRIFEIMGYSFKNEAQKKLDRLTGKKTTKTTLLNSVPTDLEPEELKTIIRLLNILRSKRKNDRKIVMTLIDTIYRVNTKHRFGES